MGNRKKCARQIFICFLIGVVSTVVAQGDHDRRWSVRKTGEFGRRLDSLKKELQLPTKQFRLHELDSSESRRYDYDNERVRTPSVDLELPYINSISRDQDAQETESEGYTYPTPEGGNDELGGYNYDPPSPVAGQTPEEPDVTGPTPAYPSPVEPDVVAGQGEALFKPNPFARETDEDIDSQGLSARKDPPKPSSPQVSAVANSPTDDCHDYNDPTCWSHDYSDVIPGVAGTDYPVLASIVETSFSCDEQQYSGYYADFDEASRCQIFHICLKRSNYRKTRQWSFLCPNGTLFSQQELVCVLWTDAPDCTSATVRSLYNINEQLGWDNVTEITGNKIGGGNNANGELHSAMSAFLEAQTQAKSTSPPRTGLAYRVPIKVNEGAGRPRTKLQEVTQNALHGNAHELDYGDNTEHEVEESSNFETSLGKQSEARHKTKSSSSLRESQSEAYELRGSPDGVQPYIVNRPSPTQQLPQEGQTESPQFIMMPTRNRNPDGSEGYARVPVMLPHNQYDSEESEGYSYPNPNERTSTPAPTYLPPTSTSKIYTTTEDFPPPTVPTEPPINDESYEQDSQQNVDIQSTTEAEGYNYPVPTTTAKSRITDRNSGYRYPGDTDPDNRYTQPTTTETAEEGYRYQQPTTTQSSEEGYRYPNPTSTPRSSSRLRSTTLATTTEQNTEESDAGYQYPTPDEQSGYNYPNQETTTEGSQYQVTDNEVSGGYDSSTFSSRPSKNQNLESTESPATTTFPSTPAGGYLPPNEGQTKQADSDYDQSSGKQVAVDEDTVGIAGGEEEGDYEVENEVTGPTGLPESEDGYSSAPYSYPKPTPNVLDSDEKVNDILKQIQDGGIEAVDQNGKPIEFDRLKDLLLKSPMGSVELKHVDGLDSITSPSTESPNPTTPQTELPSPQAPEEPYFHTVSTANVIPPSDNANVITISPEPTGPSTSPANFYIPPSNAPQQYYTNNNVYVQQPTYEIKAPNREYESHSVLSNTIDNNRNNQYQTYQQQQLSPSYFSQPLIPPQNNYQEIQQQLPTPQQQFFPAPTLSTSLVIPRESYLPPAPKPSFLPVISSPEGQQQQFAPNPTAGGILQQPPGEYLPPRQTSSSLLQSQYYNSPAQQQDGTRPFLSQPIQLTENIQLQQSFAQPLPLGRSVNGEGGENPLVNPKDIKIVPAVFVHQHTSVANDNQLNNLDTAQSAYRPVDFGKFGTSSSASLAEQLNQLANSVYLPQGGGNTGRQFTRRSNSQSSRGTSGSASEPSHTIQKAQQVTTFTLEDARSPEELQQYHHQDLKRFHSENIAKQGGVLDDSYSPPPAQQSRRIPPPPQSNPKVEHRFVTERTTRVVTSTERRPSGNGGSKNSNPTRFSPTSPSGVRGRSNNDEIFIPVSGSYGGSGGRSSTSSSNSEGSQFRISGRGSRSGGGSGRSYFDSESESTLLRRFLPEEEGGFGARLP